MVAFVHVGTLSDILHDVKGWLEAGVENFADLIDYVEDGDNGDYIEDADVDNGEDGKDDTMHVGDEDYDTGFDEGFSYAVKFAQTYADDNPNAHVQDVITAMRVEFAEFTGEEA